MMGFLRTWLLGIVLTAFAVGLATELLPKGREKSMVRLIGGLLMVLALLRPFGELTWEIPSVSVGAFQNAVEAQTEDYRNSQQKELCAIIAENLETYIWDKATELGLACRASVDVSVQESGVPLPVRVTLDIPRDPALAVWLEEVVGIPAEQQIWQEGSTWTTEKDRSS